MLNCLSHAVLIADDDPDIRRLMESVLVQAGFEVWLACDGEEVFTILESRRPGLFLLDCRMPGLDGVEVCRRLKDDPRFRETPVVFATALSDPEDKVRGFEAGGDDYICKPVDRRELIARVRAHFERGLSRRILTHHVALLEGVMGEQYDRRDRDEALGAILPGRIDLPAWKSAVRFVPGSTPAGDYYDMVELGESGLTLFVADVSGPGHRVEFLTGGLKALASIFLADTLPAYEAMQLMNAGLRRFLGRQTFVTACMVRYDRARGECQVVSAGHPAPIYQAETGPADYLDLAGDVLGVLDEVQFSSRLFEVRPGERLFLYTNGLMENATSADRTSTAPSAEAQRLRQRVDEGRTTPLGPLLDAVMAEFRPNGLPGRDDAVLMGLEF